MTRPAAKPHVLVLGGNFAGLASAQHVRDFCGDKVNITMIERRDHLLFVPNIPADVFDNRDPADGQIMPLHPVLKRDAIAFIQGEVVGIDLDRRKVRFMPTERPDAEIETMAYDYLVIAVGARLAYDRIEGFAESTATPLATSSMASVCAPFCMRAATRAAPSWSGPHGSIRAMALWGFRPI